MDFSRDWADTVREQRLPRLSADGGAPRSYRWVVSNPRRSAWLVFFIEIAAVGVLLAVWQPDGMSDVVVELVGLALGAAAAAALVAQVLRGEKMVYDEWFRERAEPRSSPTPGSP